MAAILIKVFQQTTRKSPTPILLELICIESQVNKAHNTYSDVENLKEHILVGLRPFTEKCYHQVRELFAVNMTTNRKR